jgi:hypothetical protein
LESSEREVTWLNELIAAERSELIATERSELIATERSELIAAERVAQSQPEQS